MAEVCPATLKAVSNLPSVRLTSFVSSIKLDIAPTAKAPAIAVPTTPIADLATLPKLLKADFASSPTSSKCFLAFLGKVLNSSFTSSTASSADFGSSFILFLKFFPKGFNERDNLLGSLLKSFSTESDISALCFSIVLNPLVASLAIFFTALENSEVSKDRDTDSSLP